MMNHLTPAIAVQQLTSFFWSGDTLRSRSVSGVVLQALIDVPAPPARLIAHWERDTLALNLEPGDVEALTLVRTRATWPGYKHGVTSMADWMRGLGLVDILDDVDVALMVCRGARYHNDALQYGSAAFCNLFLSDSKSLDLHFPAIGLRVPLQRGLAVIFDTGQPHAVVKRGSSEFNAEDFLSGQDCSQYFLTWELPIESTQVASALEVTLDTNRSAADQLGEPQVRLGNTQVVVAPESGKYVIS